MDRINERVAISVIYMAAMFMSILDSTIVNVALATIGREFHASGSRVALVSIAYLVALAVSIPASGWFGDRFGGKRVLSLAILLFTLSSAACGLAQNLPLLVVSRFIQGLAGGLMTPVGMAMLYRVYGPSERAAVARRLTLVTTLAPASGPILGGLLVQYLSWRFVFLVNVPIGAAALIFGLLCLRNTRIEEPGRFDLIGLLLSGVGFGSLIFAFSEGPNLGWTSPEILVTAVLGVVLLGATVWFELRTPEPLLHLRLFGNRLFRSVNVTFLIGSMPFVGTLFLFPLYLQDGLGQTPLVAGVTTFPEAIAILLTTQLTSRLYPVIGPRRLLAGGLLVVGVAIALIAAVPPSANLWVFRGLMFLLGMGQANVFMPAQVSAFATISKRETGAGSTIFNSTRQAGAAMGVSVLSTTLGILHPAALASGAVPAPHLSAYRTAFLVAAGIAWLGSLCALRVSDADAAPTLRRRAVQGSPEAEAEAGG
ncbi:MAG: DHA2 family efflux MFS transporter permease subunit [Candidatus Dormibacteraeota bacterium]|nr:DHA2 family efflux MFS transporter permease subunit [Candidatus Dormibacteraeota bacterium]